MLLLKMQHMCSLKTSFLASAILLHPQASYVVADHARMLPSLTAKTPGCLLLEAHASQLRMYSGNNHPHRMALKRSQAYELVENGTFSGYFSRTIATSKQSPKSICIIFPDERSIIKFDGCRSPSPRRYPAMEEEASDLA
eukprot:IDg19105t1